MYQQIRNQQSLDELLEITDYFHDAILREISVLARGYVDKERIMHGDVAPTDARLIFQTQSENNPGIEIVLESIIDFKFIPGILADFSEMNYSSDRIELIMEKSLSVPICYFLSKSMKYRILDSSSLGPELRSIKDIPYGDEQNALHISDDLWQCPKCMETCFFDAEGFRRCPSCNSLLIFSESK